MKPRITRMARINQNATGNRVLAIGIDETGLKHLSIFKIRAIRAHPWLITRPQVPS